MKECLCAHLQDLLSWLIEVGITPSIVERSAFAKVYSNTTVWLEHLSFVLEFYLSVSESVKAQKKNFKPSEAAVNTPTFPHEEQGRASDNALSPLSLARSLSVPVTERERRLQSTSGRESLSL